MRTALAALAALLGVLLLTGPSPAASATSRPVAYAGQAHHVTNHARARADLDRLGKNACLRRLALEQAKAMAARGAMFHQDLHGVQDRCDMGWVGENVGFGFQAGRLVVRAWMHSPEHRANILADHFELMGIAAYRSHGVWWVSQVFGARA